jgi:hypothetical protein
MGDMMRLIRLKADYTEDQNEYIIFTLLIDQENKLIPKYEMFGYVVDATEDGLYTSPFIIKATNNSDIMTLEYGAHSEYEIEKVNLPQKEIKNGEYFTRWVNGTDEYTYVISNIEKII